jgi:DHA1 family bicyclomycin/chloramphenicol resistance-like MFS transporter
VVLTLVFAMLFSVLQSIQPIFDVTFGRAESFPLWFCLIALISGAASLLNARIVMRLGMQRVVTGALASQVVISAVVALLVRAGAIPAALSFGVFLLWITSIYVMLAFTLGNLNAMALEPMGHLAGTATSIISSAATILSVLLAVPLALLFDGTIVPLATGIAAYSAAAWLYVRQLSELMENAEPQEDFGP